MPRRVYLAGPPFAEEYRRRADPLVRAHRLGAGRSDAAGFPRAHGGHEDEIVSGDLADIDSCDAVLAAFTAPDEGTAMEAWYAHSRGKRVVAYTGGPRRIPWTVYVADAVHADLDDAVAALRRRREPMSTAVVVGAGAMGAAAARVLAERGWGVTLLEQHAIGHDLGGSGHDTRSFRLSHSDADDVRLAVRALELWNDLERRGGETLLRRNGLLQRGSVVPPMAAALREAGVRYDELDHRDVSRLFPEMRPQPDAPAIFQPDGAVILARRSILVQVTPRLSPRARSCTRARNASRSRRRATGVRAFTRRRRIDADVAVVCAGPVVAAAARPARPAPAAAGRPRAGHLVPQPAIPAGSSAPGPDGAHAGAGDLRHARARGSGYKLGWATINPMTFWKASKVRPFDRENEQALVERVREDFPGFDPTPLHHEAGPITLVPDELFVIDRRGPIVVGAACIGHAFKFSPALGELFADLAEERPLPPEARRFGLDRPTLAPERRSGRVAVGA